MIPGGLAGKISLLLFSLLLISPIYLIPQNNNIKFEHISLEHGLSQSIVYCILQDSKGFMWFGTDDGLNRYDGYQFIIYRSNPDDPFSMSDSIVRTMIEDRSGTLWIGTFKGLNKFNRKKEKFSIFQHDPKDSNSLSNNFVLFLLEDSSGMIWIGTNGGGLNRFDPVKETFTHFKKIANEPQSLTSDNVRTIFIDSNGFFWIGTIGGGLNKFEPKTGAFKAYRNDPDNPNSLADDTVSSIIEDPDGILWIGSYGPGGGLNRFDPQTETFTRYQFLPQKQHSLSSNWVRDLFLDNHGKFWVGTSNGLNEFNREDEVFINHLSKPTDFWSLSNNTIRSMYEDKSGVLWFGTEFGCLNRLIREKQTFKHFYNVPDDPMSLSNNVVMSIYEDSKGTLWVGTYGGGLNKRDKGKKGFTHFLSNPDDKSSLSNNSIWSIFQDRSNLIWIATKYGLNKFNEETGTFKRYYFKPENPADPADEFDSNLITSMCQDKKGYLWVGTWKGLNKFNKQNGSYKRYLHDPDNPNSICNNEIWAVYEETSAKLWIGTNKGLNILNTEEETFSYYNSNPKDPKTLSHNVVIYIFEDNKNNLWFGTYGGLNRYDRETDSFTSWTEADGLPNNIIYGILEDDDGILWLSTNKGLSRFNPKNETFKNYDVWDGLQSNEFKYGACWKSRTGELLFGGINGFNAFDPKKIKDNPFEPSVVITDLKIFNKSVNIGKEINGRIILKEHISETSDVHLSYKHTEFSIEYASLHYAAPEANQYAYKMEGLEGLEKEWNYVGNRRHATFAHLNPGKYVFRVKGSNKDNIWNETGTSLKIFITPPFWQERWFQGLVIFICLSLLFTGYRYRVRNLKKKLVEKEKNQRIIEDARNLAEFRHAEIEKLITAISSILIAVDADKNIVHWNEAAERTFKTSQNEVTGRSFTDILTPYISKEILNKIIEIGLGEREHKPVHNMEIQVDFKEKGLRLLQSSISPIVKKTGSRRGFILLAEDITYRKEEQRQRFLSQKLESLGQMAGNIAHEIKTPLQYINDNGRFVYDSMDNLLKFCEILNESLIQIEKSEKDKIVHKINKIRDKYDIEYLMEELPQAAQQIVTGVTRVSRIVRSMKEYSHPGKIEAEKADINQIIQTTLDMIQDKKKKKFEIRTEFYESLPETLCFPGELSQVFLNLLINAADSIQEKGEYGIIKIYTTVEDGEILITITDTGRGIPDDIKDSIFNPFFTTKKPGKGTGQGLYIVHNIIEKHKGKILFKSNPIEGTTFYIHLPIRE
jgi:PAS domain S-box-containing protein